MTSAALISLTIISHPGPSAFSPVAGVIADPVLLGLIGFFIAFWVAAFAVKRARRTSRAERD